MRRLPRNLLLSSAAMLLVAVACQAPPPAPPPAAAATPQPTPVERGKYIVTTSGCHDCHTPFKMGPQGPEPDMARALSGHPADAKLPPPPKITEAWNFVGFATFTAFYGPWGISFAANLTPDQNTGTGIWTEDQFVQALRTGKHMGVASSRDILPPMPWPVYGKMTDADLKAIYAYLRTVPAIANRVPEPIAPPDVAKMK